MKKLGTLKNYGLFPPEQHGKNINGEKQGPQSCSPYHTHILTDSPLHPGHGCRSQPSARKFFKKAGRKKSRESARPCKEGCELLWARAEGVVIVTEPAIGACDASRLRPRLWASSHFLHPAQSTGCFILWARHSVSPKRSAHSQGSPLLYPAWN